MGEQREGFGNYTKMVATDGNPICPAPKITSWEFNGRQLSRPSMYINTIIFGFWIASRRGEVLEGILPCLFGAPHRYP